MMTERDAWKGFVCPRCGNKWYGPPVISLYDHRTEICGHCRNHESVAQYNYGPSGWRAIDRQYWAIDPGEAPNPSTKEENDDA